RQVAAPAGHHGGPRRRRTQTTTAPPAPMNPMSRSGALLLAGSLLAAPPLTAQDGAATAAPATASEPQATEDAPVLLVRPSGVYLDLAEQGGDLTTLLTGGGSKPKPFYEMLEQLRDAAGAASPTLLFDLSGSFQLNA